MLQQGTSRTVSEENVTTKATSLASAVNASHESNDVGSNPQPGLLIREMIGAVLTNEYISPATRLPPEEMKKKPPSDTTSE